MFSYLHQHYCAGRLQGWRGRLDNGAIQRGERDYSGSDVAALLLVQRKQIYCVFEQNGTQMCAADYAESRLGPVCKADSVEVDNSILVASLFPSVALSSLTSSPLC